MQNMTEVVTSGVGELFQNKTLGEKLRLSHHQEVDFSPPFSRVSNRGRIPSSYPLCAAAQQNKTISSPIIAEKYQIFEQVEGSSLYRCVNIETQEELVCKVSQIGGKQSRIKITVVGHSWTRHVRLMYHDFVFGWFSHFSLLFWQSYFFNNKYLLYLISSHHSS